MDTSAEAPMSPEVVIGLVSNHGEFLAFLQKRLADRALAEDIPQEAFFVLAAVRLGSQGAVALERFLALEVDDLAARLLRDHRTRLVDDLAAHRILGRSR